MFAATLLAPIAAAAPSYAATVKCNPVTYRFAVTEASVSIVIGTVSVVKNACVTSGVSGLSSSSGKLTWSASGAGSTTGWKWLGTSTSLVSRGTSTAAYKSSGGLQLCVPTQISPLCASDETFSVSYVAYGPNFIGPPALPQFSCVSSGCHLHFAYSGLG